MADQLRRVHAAVRGVCDDFRHTFTVPKRADEPLFAFVKTLGYGGWRWAPGSWKMHVIVFSAPVVRNRTDSYFFLS